jgi:alpha-methylacyl-CoA racemase
LDGLGVDPEEVGVQHDRATWPAMRSLFARRFASRTRDEWAAHFAGMDACVAPVLSMVEAKDHPHLKARDTFVDVGGVVQPAPAPRFSVTPSTIAGSSPLPGADTDAVLAGAGFSPEEVNGLRSSGAVA